MEYKITDNEVSNVSKLTDNEKLEILKRMEAVAKAFPIILEETNKIYTQENERKLATQQIDMEQFNRNKDELFHKYSLLEMIEVDITQAIDEFYLSINENIAFQNNPMRELYIEVLDREAVIANDKDCHLDRDPYYQPGIYNSDYIEMGDTGYYFRLM